MKSVIAQGATVAKAIDEALTKAGMPQEFFIKVLEEAQPGFLGFGSKKAKIALFFKKEDKRHDSSLLSRGTYKGLFNNEKLQAQPAEQDKVEKDINSQSDRNMRGQQVRQSQHNVAAKPLVKVDGLQKKQEAQSSKVVQDNKHKEHAAHQARKSDVNLRHKAGAPKQDKEPVPMSQRADGASQRSVPVEEKSVRPMHRRPFVQRPLKSLSQDQKLQEKEPVATPLASSVEKQIVAPNKGAAPVQNNNEAQTAQLEKRKPRRRRHYGYRSKAPVQWGKSQDEPVSPSDERNDSESE